MSEFVLASLPLVREVTLVEDSSHVIGSLGSAAVGRDGSLFVADARMRETKIFGRDGAFAGVLGSFGGGPGQYRTPVSVRVAPFDTTVVVTDLTGNRALVFDMRSRGFLTVHSLPGPTVIPYTVMLGRADTVLWFGKRLGPPDSALADGLVLVGGQVVREVMPRPVELQHSPLAVNVVQAVAGQAPHYVFAAHNGAGVLHRLRYDGSSVDSLRLPSTVAPGVSLPAVLPQGGMAALDSVVKAFVWIRSLTPLSDTLVVVELSSYDRGARDWLYRPVIVDWPRRRLIVAETPCACRVLGAIGDTVAFQVSEAPEPFRVQWRVVSGGRR